MAPLSRQAEAAEPSQPTADANDEDEADAEEEEGVATKPGPKRARRRHREDAAEAKAERAEAEPSESDASPPDGQVASLAIKRLVLATGVSGREPVGAAASFVAGAQPKVYAFLEVQNPSRVASHVTVTFVPLAGGAPTGIRVEVGAATRWRTWATSRHVKTPGPWQVVVRDAEGTVLARQAFEVTPGIPTDTTKPDAA